MSSHYFVSNVVHDLYVKKFWLQKPKTNKHEKIKKKPNFLYLPENLSLRSLFPVLPLFVFTTAKWQKHWKKEKLLPRFVFFFFLFLPLTFFSLSSSSFFLFVQGCDENTKTISIHLGSGCSITAIKGGKVIDTSMGFTPFEGLIMG